MLYCPVIICGLDTLSRILPTTGQRDTSRRIRDTYRPPNFEQRPLFVNVLLHIQILTIFVCIIYSRRIRTGGTACVTTCPLTTASSKQAAATTVKGTSGRFTRQTTRTSLTGTTTAGGPGVGCAGWWDSSPFPR